MADKVACYHSLYPQFGIDVCTQSQGPMLRFTLHLSYGGHVPVDAFC
jgi:hypothetical protein